MHTRPGRARPATGQENSRPPATGARRIVELAGVDKDYVTGKLVSPALRDVDLSIAAGEMVAIAGPSGSGKSTITNLIAGIDRPTRGTVTVNGRRLDTLKEEALARWRGDNIGIVFQFFQLLPTLTALENAMLPMDFARVGSPAERIDRARHHLGLVGLADKADRLPLELSGGEQQRVAIARALACDPGIVIGDEPTGNLDSHNAAEMFELLVGLHRRGTTVIFVTHDAQLAARAPRTVTVRDGRVVDDTAGGRPAVAVVVPPATASASGQPTHRTRRRS
jgi:putative ABC transport system ATP-binding protein